MSHEESEEASKQIAIAFLGSALIASVAIAYLRPETVTAMVGVASAIVTALAAVVKR